jgi:hypothetical protein
MNCPECQELLQRRLDGEPLLDRTELNQHLAACPECRERHAAAGLLEEGLRLLPRPTPPAHLAQRTAEQLIRDRLMRLRRRRVWASLALAASVLLAALAGYFALWPEGQKQPVAVAPPAKKDPPPRDGPTLRQGAQEARQALGALADRVGDQLRDQGGLFGATRPAAPSAISCARCRRCRPRSRSLGTNPLGGDIRWARCPAQGARARPWAVICKNCGVERAPKPTRLPSLFVSFFFLFFFFFLGLPPRTLGNST